MLDERHLQHFDQQGYLIVENALPQSLVSELEDCVDRIHQEQLDEKWVTTEPKNFFYRILTIKAGKTAANAHLTGTHTKCHYRKPWCVEPIDFSDDQPSEGLTGLIG